MRIFRCLAPHRRFGFQNPRVKVHSTFVMGLGKSASAKIIRKNALGRGSISGTRQRVIERVAGRFGICGHCVPMAIRAKK